MPQMVWRATAIVKLPSNWFPIMRSLPSGAWPKSQQSGGRKPSCCEMEWERVQKAGASAEGQLVLCPRKSWDAHDFALAIKGGKQEA